METAGTEVQLINSVLGRCIHPTEKSQRGRAQMSHCKAPAHTGAPLAHLQHPCNPHSQLQQLQLHQLPTIKSFRRGKRGGSVADTHFWLSHSSERVSSECRTCGHPRSRSGRAPWSPHGVWSSGCLPAWSSYIFPLRRRMKWEQPVRPCSLWNCLYRKETHQAVARWRVWVKGQGLLWCLV